MHLLLKQSYYGLYCTLILHFALYSTGCSGSNTNSQSLVMKRHDNTTINTIRSNTDKILLCINNRKYKELGNYIKYDNNSKTQDIAYTAGIYIARRLMGPSYATATIERWDANAIDVQLDNEMMATARFVAIYSKGSNTLSKKHNIELQFELDESGKWYLYLPKHK